MGGDWLKGIDPTRFDHQVYTLFRLGHFLGIMDDVVDLGRGAYELIKKRIIPGCEPFKAAVRSFQSSNACGREGNLVPLTIDGEFGPMTSQAVRQRFCGSPDVLPRGGKPRWGKHDLVVWHDMSQLRGVTFEEAKTVYMEACDMITEVCNLNFTWGTSYNIFAHARRIDGGGGTLAWSYLPSGDQYNGRPLEQRYDTAENFGGNRLRTFCRPTMCHEILHAVGLGHSRDPNDIMYPSINGTQKPASGDIRELVARYGQPVPTDPDEPDPPDGPPPSPTDVIKDGDHVVIEGKIRKLGPSVWTITSS